MKNPPRRYSLLLRAVSCSPRFFTSVATGFHQRFVGSWACSVPRGVGWYPATPFRVGFCFHSRFAVFGAFSALSLSFAVHPRQPNHIGATLPSSSSSACSGAGTTTLMAPSTASFRSARSLFATCRRMVGVRVVTSVPAVRLPLIHASVAATPQKLTVAKKLSRAESPARFSGFSAATNGKNTFDQAPNLLIQRTAFSRR